MCFLAFVSTSNLAYAVSIATNSDITFSFTEAVRLIDNTALDDTNVDSVITLKNNDADGANLSFTATINSAKTIITINPTNNFTSGQIIYAYIGADVEDFNDNVVPATSKTFTAEYLVEDLTNPLDDKDFVGLLKAQAETAKRLIQQSTTSVLKRMEWVARQLHLDQALQRAQRRRETAQIFDSILAGDQDVELRRLLAEASELRESILRDV